MEFELEMTDTQNGRADLITLTSHVCLSLQT